MLTKAIHYPTQNLYGIFTVDPCQLGTQPWLPSKVATSHNDLRPQTNASIFDVCTQTQVEAIMAHDCQVFWIHECTRQLRHELLLQICEGGQDQKGLLPPIAILAARRILLLLGLGPRNFDQT